MCVYLNYYMNTIDDMQNEKNLVVIIVIVVIIRMNFT